MSEEKPLNITSPNNNGGFSRLYFYSKEHDKCQYYNNFE